MIQDVEIDIDRNATPQTSMDHLTIRKIRAYGYTGFLPEETKLGQWFEVDLIFHLDLSRSAQSDDITDTLDYREAIGCVKSIIQTQPFKLVERLTGAIADALLALPLPFKSVTVRLTKLTPPIPEFDGEITIELTRSRIYSHNEPRKIQNEPPKDPVS